MMRRFAPLIACLLTGMIGASCASVDKQNAVRRIARAVETVGLRAGTITVATRPIDVPSQAVPGVRVPKIDGGTPALAPASLRVVLDRGARRAALLAPPAAAARIGISEGQSFPALVLFAGDRVYVRSSDVGLIGARAWLGMDLTELGAVTAPATEELAQPRSAGDLTIVSPIQVLDLALGLLTGSVKRPSPSTVKGNASIEKEYRERDREPSDSDDFLQILRLFAVKDDINPIGVELDAAQRIKAITIEFVGKPEYGVKFGTRFALTLDPVGPPIDKSVLAIPARADVVEVSSLGDLRAAVDAWTLSGVGS